MTQRDSNRDERSRRLRDIESTPQEPEVLPPQSASTPDPRTGARSATSSPPKAEPSAADADPLARLRATQRMKPVEEHVAADTVHEPTVEKNASSLLDFKSFFNRNKAERPAASPDANDRAPRPVRQWKFAPAFWTVASTLSLIVNLILIVIIFFLLSYVSKLNIQVNQILGYASLPEATVKGLYENFVLMDNAHIRRDIPVSLEVPVKFDITINTQTEVTLSQDTPISQARVTLSTGGLNITNAPANIILPAGTRLPINLSLVVPVDKTVPVSLVVHVDIPLNETDLHQPFTGLRQVVQPLYCLLNPDAISNAGLLLCLPPVTP